MFFLIPHPQEVAPAEFFILFMFVFFLLLLGLDDEDVLEETGETRSYDV